VWIIYLSFPANTLRVIFCLVTLSRIVVIDVYADWCGPCKQIASRYERLANEMYIPNELILIKENVESGISDGVKGVPTFQIYKKAR